MEETKKRRNTGQTTLSDVAKLAGVGTMTVSRALRTPEQVSNKLRQKIDDAVNELGYRPNLAASSLASAIKSNLIVIITSKIYDNGGESFINAMQKALVEQGYTTLVVESYLHKNKTALLSSICSYNLAAVALFNMEDNTLIQDALINQNIPIISIGARSNSHVDMNIGIDNMQAMYTLTDHVIKKGYRYVGLLCANHEHIIFQQRLHGWHKAMLDHHLPTHRVINAGLPANFTTGSQLLADFILNWPEIDVLICTTDELACGALYECQRRHIRVPHQLAIAGFGNSEFSQVSYPPLTTVALPYELRGKQAADELLKRVNVNDKLDNLAIADIPPLLKERSSL